MTMRIFAALLAITSFALPLHAQTADPALHMTGAGPVSTGGFVGARLRLSLGGNSAEDPTIRAGLTVAPMLLDSGADLRSPAWRIGDGLEFGFRDDDPTPQLSLAGLRLTPSRYAPYGRTPTRSRNNLSDGGTVALALVGLVAAAGVGLLVAIDSAGDPDSCTPGECNNN